MSATAILPNGIQLAYESFGADDAPAVLLIMGLGTQMVRWNIELCDQLVAMGYRVIRFDNRDCGRSNRNVAASTWAGGPNRQHSARRQPD